jgi:predicted LPLAT superfamily acyltransferase
MAKKWEGKSKGSVLGYKIFVYTIQFLGLGFAYFILRFVALYYLFFSWKSNKSLSFYYKRILHLSPLYSWWYIYKSYFTFGQTLLDRVVVMASDPNKVFTFEHENGELLKEMVRGGKGGILISAHMGNWEVAGHFLGQIDRVIHIVMYDAEHEKIKDYLSNVVKKKTFNIIVINELTFSHVYEIADALSKNEIVCMHGDRYVEGSKAISYNFLGEEALFPFGPFYLAVQNDVPVYFVYGFKDNNKHYHLYTFAPNTEKMVAAKSKKQKAEVLLNEYVLRLEVMVKRYPEQWFNFFRFWK